LGGILRQSQRSFASKLDSQSQFQKAEAETLRRFEIVIRHAWLKTDATGVASLQQKYRSELALARSMHFFVCKFSAKLSVSNLSKAYHRK
jgi:hypothetical protein